MRAGQLIGRRSDDDARAQNIEPGVSILQSIRSEVEQQGQISKEVVGYFRTIPQILNNLEVGGGTRDPLICCFIGIVLMGRTGIEPVTT